MSLSNKQKQDSGQNEKSSPSLTDLVYEDEDCKWSGRKYCLQSLN
jgi:hypothetical protein